MSGERNWGTSLRQTFRLLPEASSHLRPFLQADGLKPEDVLANLPYESARSRAGGGQVPDAKRYRDPKQVYQSVGLLFEADVGRLQVTDLGQATLRWIGKLTNENAPVLGRHAAFALAACQLRNPTGAGRKYDASMRVFPFSFIWRAMLALDGKLSSDELNRSLLKVSNEDELAKAVEEIRSARAVGDAERLGAEVVTGQAKNDRIIPWMSLASFGWLLFSDKKSTADEPSTNYYELFPRTRRIVEAAAALRHRHREFESVTDYVQYISACAGLPEDLR